MTLILKMESDLKIAWDLVQRESNLSLRHIALRAYKNLLEKYLKQKLFIAYLEPLVPG